jgi:hypothetical protein
LFCQWRQGASEREDVSGEKAMIAIAHAKIIQPWNNGLIEAVS